MSSSHRFARSLAVASSAILLVVGASFAHDSASLGAPGGGATTPATWQGDDDRQATDFLAPAPAADEDDQGGDNAQGDEDEQGDDQEVHRRDAGEEDHMVAGDDESEGVDENDDDQGEDGQDEDADENDGEHEDADDGDTGDQGEHDGDHEGGDSGVDD
jgi:hypothetical protein